MNDSSDRPGISRRAWLLSVGDAIVLAGLSGTAANAAVEQAAQPAHPGGAGTPSLPPGLYLPSEDHLSHAMGAERYYPAAAGTEVDFVRPRPGPYTPRFFSPDEYRVVHRIAEMMLGQPMEAESAPPPVDEVAEWIDLSLSQAAPVREAALRLPPAHRALAVAYYGAEPVEHVERQQPDRIAREGMQWLAAECQSRHGAPFDKLTAAQQNDMLTAMSDARPRAVPDAGAALFTVLKNEIVRGFYTSKAGLEELRYTGNSYYPSPPGCTHT